MKKVVLTGVKPTDRPHLGNYLGAMRPALSMAKGEGVRSFFFIADYHAITTVTQGDELRSLIYELTASWLACGLDPQKTVIYKQSDIPEIMELSWILSCFCPKGLMNRAHAYKAKINANQEAGKSDLDDGVSMGLFTYTILMSADILAFDTDEVPVGEDQIQHVEYARDIAEKFNRNYGEVLRLPKYVVQKAKLVPGLDGRKMSKSYKNHIPLFLDPKKMRKLIMKIKTDSSAPEDPKDPSDSVIMDLYKQFASPEDVEALSAKYRAGIGWGEAKQCLFEAVDAELSPCRERYEHLMANTQEMDEILERGAQEARKVAVEVLGRVRSALGVRH